MSDLAIWLVVVAILTVGLSLGARRRLHRERARNSSLAAALQALSGEFEQLAVAIGEALAPAIRSATEALNDLVNAWNRSTR